MNKAFAAAILAVALTAAAAAEPRVEAYITGGIGLEERAAMLAHRADFNLQLVFAVRRSGNYLAGVETLIAGEDGQVLLKVTSEGPFLYARLAPGRYIVAATHRGETQRREVAVQAQGTAFVALYWDDPAALEGRGIEPERKR